MISCEVVRRHIDAFVDGEVDADTLIEFEQHLTGCGPCRVHLAFARSIKEQVRDACAAPAVPAGLRSRLQEALDREDLRRAAAEPAQVLAPADSAAWRTVPVRARFAVPAAAAAVALAVLAAREGGNPTRDESPSVMASAADPARAIFDDIVRRHSSEHPAEVSGPPTTVASWFRDKLEFPVHPVAFASPEAHLVGARLSNVQDRQAAAFYYDVGGHRVTVMVFEPPQPVDRLAQRTSLGGRGIYYGRAHGRTIPMVEYEGLTYAFTGDLDSSSLLRLAATARMADH